jgi:hypothetical protein
MKKSIALVALAFGVTSAFAQDLLDKKQRPILPEAKDWGISIDATPFINLASDMVHIGAAGTNTAGLNFNGLNDKNQNYSIAGKYFMNNTTAYRGIVRVYNNTNTEVAFINKLNLNPTATNWPNNIDPEKVKDMKRENDWAVGIGGGLEKRKGTKYRLQGYYGGEASLILAGSGEKYKYGNAIVANTSTVSGDDDNLTKYTTDFGGNVSTAADHDERTLSVRNGKTLALAVRGYVGVEYFFTAKMSVGGEFGWGLGYYRTGRGSQTVEGLDRQDDNGTVFTAGSEVIVSDQKIKTGGVERGLFFGNDRSNTTAPTQLWMNSYSPSGKLSFNFYF